MVADRRGALQANGINARLVAVVLVVLGLVGACGVIDDEVAAGSTTDPTAGSSQPPSSAPSTTDAVCTRRDCPSGSPSIPPGSSPDLGHRRDRPIVKATRPDLVAESARPFEAVYATSATEILVAYWGGVQDCDVPANVGVEESGGWVRITLRTGAAPDRAEPCPDVAEWQAVRITLDEPLNGRQIVDAVDGDRIVALETPSW